MPARKPASLITRHETAAEKRQRSERESALRPEQSLPKSAPAALSGHAVAESVWRRLMRLYSDIEGEIVTRLDMDILVDYCLLTEQVTELDAMRKSAHEIWQQIEKERLALIAQEKMAEAITLVNKAASAFDAVVKLDSRADRKRALMFQLRQSLYLTPRSRAGVAPAQKEAEEAPDEMEQLLSGVNTFLNGDDK